MENNVIEKKQIYLREEVLEKGYNGEEFLEFLIEQKGENAADLNLWKLEELKDAVEEFKRLKTMRGNELLPSLSDVQQNKFSKTEVESSLFNYKPDSNKQMDLKNLKLNNLQDYDEIVTCKKLDKTPLSDCQNVKILISDPEKHEGGIFTSAYYSYLISTHVLNSKVRRRYSDFSWLREMLCNFFPGIFIPPIPKKKLLDKTNENLSQKRMRYLQKFLDTLAKSKVIRSSKILYDFLTVEDKEEFTSIKNKYSKMQAPVILTDFENIEGIIDIKVNSGDEQNAQTIAKTVNANEILLKKLNDNIKNLLSDLENVGNRLREVSTCFSQLYQCSEMGENHIDVVNSYKMLTSLTSNWSASYGKQISVINLELREFFDYIRKEMTTFKEILAEHGESKNEYFNIELKLLNRKEELFNSGSIFKWEMLPEDMEKLDKNELLSNKEWAFSKMLVKDTNYCRSLKRNYAYHLNILLKEYQRLQKVHGKIFKNHFLNLSAKHTALLSDIFSIVKLLTCSC